MKTRIIEVIETYVRRGTGIENDPIRNIYQLWSKEGKLIYEEEDKYLKKQEEE